MLKYIDPNCYPCVLEQAISIAHHLNLDINQTRDLLDVAMGCLLVYRHEPKKMVQHVVRHITDVAQIKSGQKDIYAKIKEESHRIAVQHASRMRTKLTHAREPLSYAIKLAAAGNIIDFGVKGHSELDIEKELEQVDSLAFSRFDIDPLKEKLNKAQTLLYVCDNVGELDFDKLLMEQLIKDYPQIKIIAVMRHSPIINDATVLDAHQAGIHQIAQVISSGSVYPGTIYEESSPEYQSLYKKAHIIIAKGQGNFETMYFESDIRCFFILRVKCSTMARLSQQQLGGLVLVQGGS